MSEEMDRLHSSLTGTAVQLAHAATQTAEIAVQLAARRARAAETESADAARAAGERIRADRELAAAVWARARSERWVNTATADELVTVWASARAWAPHDDRAARAVETLTRRAADVGLPLGQATAALDARDAAALQRLLDAEPPARAGARPAESTPHPTAPAKARQARDATDDRQARVATALRAEWAPGTVEVVMDDPAWPALAAKLGQLSDPDMAVVLRSVSEAEVTGDRIRRPAAFAAWYVDKLTAAPEVRVAGEGFTAPAGEATRAGGTQPAAAARPAGRPRSRTAPAAGRSEPRER